MPGTQLSAIRQQWGASRWKTSESVLLETTETGAQTPEKPVSQKKQYQQPKWTKNSLLSKREGPVNNRQKQQKQNNWNVFVLLRKKKTLASVIKILFNCEEVESFIFQSQSINAGNNYSN